MEWPDTFFVIVKPNASTTEVVSYDAEQKTCRIAVAAAPVDGKANKELLRFLKKETGRTAALLSGKNAKKKLVRLH
jgi:hypothetical protein